MDLSKVLLELHRELEHIDAAILSLERLQETGKKPDGPRKVERVMRKPRDESRPRVLAAGKTHSG